MPRETVRPTEVNGPGWAGEESVTEEHPAFAKVVVNRVSSMPGASLFDSEIRHGHYITLRINEADRTRALHRDWIHGTKTVVEVAFSMAQWADLISSFGNGDGVSATMTYRQGVGPLPAIPFEPRLAQSMDEVHGAADRTYDKVKAALAAVEEKPTKANIRNLRMAVDSAGSNVAFAAKSLTEHVENVVTKARADVEAMVQSEAERVGLPMSRSMALGIMAADDPAVQPLELADPHATDADET
jgi:hypothetical protein